MKKISENKKLILGIIFVSMLILNMLVPIICDDYFYLYVFRTNSRITNIFDIAYSEYLHYFNWGGRVLAHSIAQTFLMMPKIVFNICNSSMYIFKIYLIYLIARKDREDNYFYLLIIHIILWLFDRSFGEVNFWLVGSCNYLWTTVIILLFFYQYVRKEENESNSKKKIFLNAILGFFAGMCNENFSCALIVMIFFFIIFMKKRRVDDIIGLVFAVIGYLFLILAPGNFSRFSAHNGSFSLMILLLRFLFLVKNFSFVFLILILWLFIYFKKDGLKKELLIYLIGILVCFCWMIISPDFSLRSLTGCVIFITIIIVYTLFDYKFSKKYFLLIIVPFLFSYVVSFFDMCSLNSYWRDFERDVEVAKKNKLSDFKYSIFSSKNTHIPGAYDLVLIDCDSEAVNNQYLALYYGVDKVIGSGDRCDKKKYNS